MATAATQGTKNGAFIMVGCRLPNGFTINAHDRDPEMKVTLKGQNSDPAYKRAPFIVLAGDAYGITPVPERAWEKFKAENKDFPALTNGAIFVAKSLEDADAMARELENENTGFFPMPQTAEGVKPADEKE